MSLFACVANFQTATAENVPAFRNGSGGVAVNVITPVATAGYADEQGSPSTTPTASSWIITTPS